MSSAHRSLTYRPELDGLRAVAVLVVIVHHVWQPGRFAGFVGVDIFFVLSGYLITTILLRERHQTGKVALGLFYARRLLRLYPALLLMLAGTTIGYSWLSGSLAHQIKDGIFAATYTGNVYMVYGHAWIGPYAHTWSLALEEQYYLIWPLVLLTGLRLTRRPAVLVAGLLPLALASALLYAHQFSYNGRDFSPPSTAFGLITGSALALLLASRPVPASARRFLSSRPAAAGGVILLGAVLVGFSLTRAVPDGIYAPAAVVASSLIIGSCISRPRNALLPRALAWRPAVGIGKISYGIYLWHYPVVTSVRHFWPTQSPWIVLVAVLAITVLLAFASYRYVELPFLRWKDRLRPRPVESSVASTSISITASEAGAVSDACGAIQGTGVPTGTVRSMIRPSAASGGEEIV